MKTSVLFIFMDGVGLGPDDAEANPFARQRLPVIESLLDGHRLVAHSAPLQTRSASLLALDASLGVTGLPQSATGQAALLTGRNVPGELGYHYGPKPNPAVAERLSNGNIFSRLLQHGKTVAFLNAYPPGYFEAIQSRLRLYSAFPLAAVNAGLPLRGATDLYAGRAISADFTGQGWRERLGFADAPLLTPYEAGAALARLASQQHFSVFEYWLSDYAGHSQDMQAACQLLSTFDQVLGGLLSVWNLESNLVLVTSDHGNLEDLRSRRHTLNPVPALLFGSRRLRQEFSQGLQDLTGVAPAILRLLGAGHTPGVAD